MIEIIFYSFIGSAIGFISGLIPSLHQNLLIPIFLTFLFQNEILAVTFLISLAISQNFGNAISSYYLSSPPEELSLSTLPSQRLAKKGLLIEVLKIYILSATICTPISVIFSFLFHQQISKFIFYLKDYTALIILISMYTIFFFEKNKIKSLIIFLLAGILGLISFNLIEFNKAVLAMFSGFFALSQVLINFLQKENFLQDQFEDVEVNLKKKDIIIGTILVLFLGIFAGLLPSLGTSQIILIFQPIINDRMFIFLNSGISFSNEVFSTTSLYIVGNARSGLSAYLEQSFGKIDYEIFILMLSTLSLSLFFGSIMFLLSYKTLFKFFQKINFRTLNLIVAMTIIFVVYKFSGLLGLIILFTSTSLSFITILSNVKRSYLMGSLILSTILIYTNFYHKILSLLNI